MAAVPTLEEALATAGAAAAPVVPAAAAALEPYDCQAEADIWEWAWTPDWKDWCCQHESKGCPPTTTQTVTATATSTGTETTSRTLTETGTSTETQTVTRTPTTHADTSTKTMTSTETMTRTETRTETEAETTAKAQLATSVAEHAADTVKVTTSPTSASTTEPDMVDSTTEPDMGCQSDCVIMGEHANCQDRITWVEEHQTGDEIAPCPAAHVMVMSQCASCGTCQFKDVVCASQQGVSKSENTFMYKYAEDQAGAVHTQLQPHRLPAAALAGITLVPFAIALGVVMRQRHRSGRAANRLHTEGDLNAFMVPE